MHHPLQYLKNLKFSHTFYVLCVILTSSCGCIINIKRVVYVRDIVFFVL